MSDSHHAARAAVLEAALESIRQLIDDDTGSSPHILHDAICQHIEDALAETYDARCAIEAAARTLTTLMHDANKRWWRDPLTGRDLRGDKFVVPVKLMLAVSELSEAMEADRKGLKDDKLPHRDGVEVEIADTVIRAFDLAGAKNLPVAEALVAVVSLPREAVGMAMCLRTLFDLCGALDIDLAGAAIEKMAFNDNRKDHTDAARAAVGGKSY